MPQSIIFIPAGQLTCSPANVRRHFNPLEDAKLEANIVAKGILQNLIGLPVPRKKGHYHVIAGNRRLRAVHHAIEAGTLPADFKLPLLPLADPNDAIEIGLAENFFKLDMNPADACLAFQAIIEVEQKSPADIARRFGLTERFVLGRLRLAELAPVIFEALGQGSISLEMATAYASCCDTQRQESVFQALAGTYQRDNPDHVRRQLASLAYSAHDPRALLVGRDKYLAEGGRIDRDLFTSDDEECWLDTHIVDRLAEEAMTAAAIEIQASQRFGEVRSIAATRIPYMDVYDLERLDAEPVPLNPEQEQRQAEIEARIEEIEAQATLNEDEFGAEDEQELRRLEAELEEIGNREPHLDEDQRATAIAYLLIGPTGVPQIHQQFYRRPEEEPVDDEPETPLDEDAPAEPSLPAGRPVASQRLVNELAMARAELLALHVARSPELARTLGTFIMVDLALGNSRSWDMPSELRASRPSPLISGHESSSRAAEEWDALEAALDRTWAQGENLIERYEAFQALAAQSRDLWLAWAVARSLDAVPGAGGRAALLDRLGMDLKIDSSAWWRPTASNYFDRISRSAILDILARLGSPELRERYARARKHDLALAAEKLFSGQLIVEADIQARLCAWVPDEMTFGSYEETQAVIEQATQDAAPLDQTSDPSQPPIDHAA